MSCDNQVIVLFDDLLPASSTFKSQGTKLHGIPSIETLGKSQAPHLHTLTLLTHTPATVGQLSLVEAKKFLIRYLVSLVPVLCDPVVTSHDVCFYYRKKFGPLL